MRSASMILERFDGPLVSAAGRPFAPASDAARRAYEEGCADGYAKGLAEARAQAEDDAQKVGGALRAAIDAFSTAQQESQNDAARQAVKAAVALAGAVLPELARRGLVSELAAVLREATKTPAIRSLTVMSGPGAIEDLRTAMADASIETSINFVADEKAGPAAARISWEGGGVEIDLEAATAAGLRALNESLNEKSE